MCGVRCRGAGLERETGIPIEEISLISRYESQLNRQLFRAIKELRGVAEKSNCVVNVQSDSGFALRISFGFRDSALGLASLIHLKSQLPVHHGAVVQIVSLAIAPVVIEFVGELVFI